MIGKEYKRPEKGRDIPKKWGSIRGKYNCTKPHLYENGKSHRLDHESDLERKLYYLLDQDPNCRDIQSQPALGLEWESESGKKHPFHPDTWAIFYDGTEVIFQVKNKTELKSLEDDSAWLKQCEVLSHHCKDNGMIFKIITEDELETARLDNVELLHYNAQHPPQSDPLEKARNELYTIFKKSTILVKKDAILKLSKRLRITSGDSSNLIEYLMYKDFFYFVWEKRVTDDTPLKIRGEYDLPLEPVYKIEPPYTLPKPEPHIPAKSGQASDVDRRDMKQIPEKEIKIAEKYFGDIEPLQERYALKKLTRGEVEKRAKEVGVCTATIYNLLNKFEKDGKRGLLPRYRFRGSRKPQVSPEVEELIDQAKKDFLNGMLSKKACYLKLVRNCKESGLKIPCYSAFDSRIKKIPASEIRGVQNAGIRNGIPRRLTGKGIPPARRPLELVYLDHTKLDIWVVDQHYKKPIGRPWLTIAIDAYSRMVYGYYLGLEDASSVSVGMTLVRGILPKDDLLKKHGKITKSSWEIHGLPGTLKWDNGKQFDSKAIEEFCHIHCINHEFIPVRRPDLNGIVERFQGRINMEIRDAELPGYAPPLQVRPKGYDPKKEAALTLQDLENWLVNFFIVYHSTVHSALGKSPKEKYIEGTNDMKPHLPKYPESLWFDMLPFELRSLQPYGVKLWGLNYNSDELMDTRRCQNGDGKVVIRYDPRDIRWVYWYNRDREEYVPIEMVGATVAGLIPDTEEDLPLSLGEFRRIKGELTKRSRAVSPFNIEDERHSNNERALKKGKKNLRALKELDKQKNNLDNNLPPRTRSDKENLIDETSTGEEAEPAPAFRWPKNEDIDFFEVD